MQERIEADSNIERDADKCIKDRVVSRVLLIILILNTIFWSFLGGFLSIFDRRGNLAHICNRQWAKLNLFFGAFKVDVRGLENASTAGPYVVVSNHQGLFDIVMHLGLLPMQFRFVSKKENFRVPFLGWAMRFARYIELDRGRLKAAKAAMDRCADVLSQGISVVIYPEGTRSKDGRIQRFSKGAFQLALRSRVPILTITILGTQKAISEKGLHIAPCPVKMIVSKAIEVTDYGENEAKRLMEDARKVIVEQFERYGGSNYPLEGAGLGESGE